MNFDTRFPPSIRDGVEASVERGPTRGHSRTSLHHQAHVFETSTSGEGVVGKGCDNKFTDSTDIPEGASGAGDVSDLPAGHRQQGSSPYPGIQMELDPESGLHRRSDGSAALGEFGASGGVASMPFLGFDSFGDLEGSDRADPEFDYQETRDRRHSASFHDLDFGATAESFGPSDDIAGEQVQKGLEGGCDLGWDGSVMEPLDYGERTGNDPAAGEGEEDDEHGDMALDLEGRPQEVPEIDSDWATTFLSQSRRTARRAKGRARTHSFYEDDDVIAACIERRPPPRRASTSVVDGTDFCMQRDSDRFGSLAYSSSGEIPAYRPEGWASNRFGMSAQAALAAVQKVPMESSLGKIEGVEDWTGSAERNSGTSGVENKMSRESSSSSACRKLKPNEVQALEQGLLEPLPSRKYTSSDPDLSSDSEADGDFSEDESSLLPPAYNSARDERPPPTGSPLGPLAIEHRALTIAADGMSPRDSADRTGAGIGAVAVSVALPGGINTSARRRGQRVLPPGVDPFLSVPERVLSPPLSPPASEADLFGARRNMSSPRLTAAPAAVFASHLPAPQHSPPRLPGRHPTAFPQDDEEEEEEEDEEEEEEEDGALGGDERTSVPTHARVAAGDGVVTRGSWSAEESRIDESEDGVEAEDRRDRIVNVTGGGDIGVDVFVGSPPATLDSLHPSRPRLRPTQERAHHIAPVSLPPSPPAPPPTQVAPRPPPELISPSPPRPPTPDGSVPPLPASPAELAPTIGTPPQHGGSLLPSDASGQGSSPSYMSKSAMLPPHPPGSSRFWSGGGGSAGGFGRTFGSGGSATGFGASGGGGISRLMVPGGPFRTNRPGYGNVVGYGSRAMYQPGSGGGNGQSSLYGSDPGSLRDMSSAWTDPGLRGRTNVQGFFSAGGGNRHMLRRGAPGQPAKKVKLLMLGDSGVGKSSLVERYTEDHFNPSTVGTFGVDFKLKEVAMNEEEVVVQVWDTAGQQRFHKITQAYYRGSHGIVLVYDVANPDTLNNIGYWMKSIRENARENADSKRVQICLVGNKVDLREEALPGEGAVMVQTEDGARIAEMYGADFFECSAKTGLRVQEAFMTVAAKAFEMYLAKPATPSSTRSRRHRSGRRRHNRNHSHGSDRDRPPRSGDSTWSMASPVSTVDGGERFDMRHCASDVSEASTASALSQTSAGSGTVLGHTPSSQSLPRANSFATGNSLASNSSSTGSPPMLLNPPSDGVLQDLMASPSSLSPATAPTALGALELSRGNHDVMRGVGGVVGMLKGKQKKAGVGGGGGGSVSGGEGPVGKKSREDEDEGDSPTGTGTLSPLPGLQRSVGNASSLADMDVPPYSPTASPEGASSSSPRRRDKSSGLLVRMFSGGGEAGGGSPSDAGRSSGEDGITAATAGGAPKQPETGISSRQHQHPSGGAASLSSGRGSVGSGNIRASGSGSGVTSTSNKEEGRQGSKPKGRKPPRVPKTKWNDGGGNLGGSGGRRGCKVS